MLRTDLRAASYDRNDGVVAHDGLTATVERGPLMLAWTRIAWDEAGAASVCSLGGNRSAQALLAASGAV